MARLNLRLFAAVAAGQIARGGSAVDEFLGWADILATLRREELILLATLHRIEQAKPPPGSGPSAFSDPARAALTRALVPDPFASAGDVAAAADACTRTGLVVVTRRPADPPLVFRTTPCLAALLALASIEGVLGRERQAH